MNDKNTGDVFFTKMLNFINLRSKIADAQYVRGIDFTQVQCGCDSIAEECLCLPQANWQTWNITTFILRGEDKGRRAWHLLRLVDDDETILKFAEKTQGDEAGKHTVNINDYGVTLKSGWGEDVPEDVEKSVTEKFKVYKEKPT